MNIIWASVSTAHPSSFINTALNNENNVKGKELQFSNVAVTYPLCGKNISHVVHDQLTFTVIIIM